MKASELNDLNVVFASLSNWLLEQGSPITLIEASQKSAEIRRMLLSEPNPELSQQIRSYLCQKAINPHVAARTACVNL